MISGLCAGPARATTKAKTMLERRLFYYLWKNDSTTSFVNNNDSGKRQWAMLPNYWRLFLRIRKATAQVALMIKKCTITAWNVLSRTWHTMLNFQYLSTLLPLFVFFDTPRSSNCHLLYTRTSPIEITQPFSCPCLEFIRLTRWSRSCIFFFNSAARSSHTSSLTFDPLKHLKKITTRLTVLKQVLL